MGYEAYKITAKYQNLSMEDMTGALCHAGAVPVERFGGTVTMEMVNDYGVIELVLREENHVNLRFSPGGRVLLTVRFAKVNDVRISGSVIALLKELAATFDTVYIRDQETNSDIDLCDTAPLLQAVTYAKYNFEYNFPVCRHKVRCRDVFCLCGHDYPAAGTEILS
ncbi:hypothetical protein SAMN02745823_02963 [Sporobacter termitidis DSM 10068]|uniref:Uncharacterized protein n=1 Tax=Sporobacter termitidis DSM 10068 TaxID=1123282 RepID=A0A1M5YXQ1_9FIRM|nr:hypothetical protein [Sporobacter termitidis]SHI16700.1 hypothetical protein SAMN02745823_02963 [Sporobacter termitidis DSM 10068]